MVSKFQEASLKKKGQERGTQAQEKCVLFSVFFFFSTSNEIILEFHVN
jgi:hypothetical protein